MKPIIWGIRGIEACTVEALRAVATESGRVEPPAGPTPRAHTAPAVADDEAQDSHSCLRSAAAGCQAAALEGERMISVIVAIIAGAGWLMWGRRSRWHTPTGPLL
jgi:hypothetical protein